MLFSLMDVKYICPTHTLDHIAIHRLTESPYLLCAVCIATDSTTERGAASRPTILQSPTSGPMWLTQSELHTSRLNETVGISCTWAPLMILEAYIHSISSVHKPADANTHLNN